MGPLRAEISFTPLSSDDSRRAVRRKLRLNVPISSSEAWSEALIHDLSETGLMIETTVPLTVGEIISFDLPIAEGAEARVVWKDGARHGCEFLTPIPKGAVSAALLQGAPESFDSASASNIDELPVGLRPTIDEIAAWKTEFERTKGASGYKLVGFRQDAEGFLTAIVAKLN